ncbi:SIR2 family NAD-dependent protein deacylase [Bacillus toyonensis]|uniref:SIR2 family NAD-dependent protein deacylase n=1 Tax=Bacillus toyonensis TaxID=155322 RepID=UPI00259F6C0D|nr:hypothetical protein [Bacillus toyonensis]MDM5258869.1 hypothetical protein [Bacillus toyonensis]
MNTLENDNLAEENTNIYRDLEDVVSALKKAKENNINVNLLIGAGCSVTANIPAAQGMVETIKKEFPGEFKRAKIKDYPNCMSKLTPSERKNLISRIVKDAEINWTHIAIAQLLKHGYINRILTLNFDNLVQRACSLVNEFPAIYDMTTSSEFRTDLLFDKSVIHLHGQHTGFILCNTEEEVDAQSKVLQPVFDQLDQKSLWIVIGYSGNNDPIFRLLAKKEIFEHRLFWVGFEKNPPSEMLKSDLLSEEKYAFFIKGFNSDDFFVLVSQQLGCFPPTFIRKPFTHLSDTLDTLATYKIPSIDNRMVRNLKIDNSNAIHSLTKNVVQKAISSIENNKTLMAQHFIMAGLFDEVIKLAEETTDEVDLEFEYQVINALRQKNEYSIAIERLNQLDSKFPNTYEINDSLASLYSMIGFSKKDTDSKKISLTNLQLSINFAMKAYNISPSLDSLTRWEARLGFMRGFYLYSLHNEEIHTFLHESTNNFIKHFKSFAVDNSDKPISITLHATARMYIEQQNFEYAQFILESIQGIDSLNTYSKANIMATWGLWYFRNININFDTSLKEGINYYQEGMSLIHKKANDDSNDKLYIAIKQQFLFEHAKFLLQHVQPKEKIISILKECIGLGEISGLYSDIHTEAIKILESINVQNTTLSEVAFTTSPNSL